MPSNVANIIRHVMQKILNPKWIFLIGVVIIGTGILVVSLHKSKGNALSPSSGPEGTAITITYPKLASAPAQATVTFYDAGAHGFYAVNNGAATYIAYDPATGLSYSAPAAADITSNSKNSVYTATVPSGICGLIVQSSQDQAAPSKMLAVTLVGPDGKPVPGTKSANFSLKCDKYTLSVKIKAVPDPVLPDGVDQSTVTATLTVKGPAQFVNGVRVNPSAPKIVLVTPLGLTPVHFDNSMGVIVPNPANVKTDLAGNAVVTVSSADAGIDKVQAIAQGIGDAIANVHFKPKITGVVQTFVVPNSPTNYQISTIPANPKDLTFDWKIIPPSGGGCGSLTGPASGLAESKNGYYHGPSDGNSNGCDEKIEMATQIEVTVTDKDGQSDTKTFPARAFEGKGLVNLP